MQPVVATKVYVAVYVALFLLLVLTAGLHLLGFGIVAALAIAFAKAILVAMFFMHVYYSSRLTTVFVLAIFSWLGILFVLTMNDYVSRGWLALPGQ